MDPELGRDNDVPVGVPDADPVGPVVKVELEIG